MGKDLNGKNLGAGITQRKDGIYHARFVNRFGKRESIYHANLSELKKMYKEALRQDTTRTNVKCEFTLDEWYQQWMDVYKYQIRDNSKRHYAQVYEKHISPVLGKKLISKITTLDITALIKDLDKRGYQYETRNKIRILFIDMFNKALLDDFVLKNPARGVRVERREQKNPRALTREEQTDFFDACKGTFYDELFTVAVLTGLRPGELCALRWQDIDLQSRIIHVTRTLVYQEFLGESGKGFHIDPPKTKASIRSVKFNERCELALKSQFRKKSMISMKDSARPLLGFEDLLFVTKFDTPINAQIFNPAIKRIVDMINESRCFVEEFELFSAHCFRHTYATRCFEAGVAPKVVQAQLGHASLKMTMDLYTHLFESKRDDELSKFSALSDGVFEDSARLTEERYVCAQNPKIVNF